MRLHRYISQAGVTSRRKAETLISEGRVELNGKIVMEMGVKVEPGDEVRVDGELIKQADAVTLIMNKPKGLVTTTRDPGGRPTIYTLIPARYHHAMPVGRLDMDTEGLLLLTSEGDLAMRLTHAKYGIEKEYVAEVRGIPTEDSLDRLRKGVFVDGRKTSPADVKLVSKDEKRGQSTLVLILHEGRKRQVREMCDTIGHQVKTLRRVRIGHLVLKGMAPGEVRLLPQTELLRLKKAVGLAGPPVD